MKRGVYTISILFTVLLASGQSIYTEFGKNRVQYHDDFTDWWMYETENFVTYWYGKGRNVAQAVIQIAEHDNAEIQTILEHRFNDKIEIVVYLDLTDLKQSNLGTEEVFASTAGSTKILGNKIFIYFDGDHKHLRQRIREGIAAVYLESMLYGTNLQEVVQNAVLLNLPGWYKDGLVSFVAEDWTPALDDQMTDVLSQRNGRYRDFHRLVKEYPTLAGHSLWHYISRTYGKSTIANILYLTRINRNLDNAILYVLGVKFEELIKGWETFILSRYPEATPWAGEDLLNLPRKNKGRITKLSLSPDGKMLVYALNDADKSRIYLRDMQSGELSRIFTLGKKNILQEPDYQYPLFAWRDNAHILSMLYEIRDVVYLTHFDPDSGGQTRELMSLEYQRIYAMDYWHADTLIFAAATDGFSDLYKYSLRTRQTFRITDDFFDDLDVHVHTIDGKRGVLFASNRTDMLLSARKMDTLLPVENFDICFMWPHANGWSLRKLTHTPLANETQPIPVQDDAIAMLSEESGRQLRKILSLRSGQTMLLSDPRIVTHHISSVNSDYTLVAFIGDGRQRMSFAGAVPESEIQKSSSEIPLKKGKEPLGTRDAMDIVDPRYLFQSEFARPHDVLQKVEEIKDEESPSVQIPATPSADLSGEPVNYDLSKVIEFRPVRAIAHRLRFKLDYVTTTMDNSLLFTSLDAYAGTKQQYEVPPLGILLKANLKDLFEDYVIEGGARFPTSFNGSEYFLYLDDLKKRFDKRYAFYRKSSTESFSTGPLDIDRTQIVTVIGQYRLSYPMDTYTSVRATLTVRNDRRIRLATDASNLNTRTADDQRVGLKAEYVYDNTVEWDVNTLHGTRYKVWSEIVKKFDLNLFEPGDKLTFNKGFMTVFGLDARHYEPLDRHSIFAARLFASTSIGSERNLYYLGGVENWLFSSFDNTIPVPGDKNFAYQTIAANMRGFNYNARNGSSVVLINTEVRVPFMRYLSRGKLRSSFLRNLQIVGFADVGTAWHGSDPFSAENPLNTLTLVSPPTVRVDIKYFRNPVVVGYGAGLRSMLFGYYFKADYAWGLDTKRRLEPKLHLSIGTDF
ncbi:MAG TPA: hypothetical protein VI603_06160 [Saprospiraceae bacterium]|nr:hypothetical protein [Saprospiraceae bacterium]